MSAEDTKTLDQVLEGLPVGWFHYRLLFICGLAFMADGMEVSLLSFVSTCAGIDWDLSDAQIALITSVVFAGELLGSMFFGPIADKYGRRGAFMLSCTIITIAGFVSGVSPNYIVLLLCRCIVGIGVGGVTVPFDLLAEFLPNSHRGIFLIYIEGFWTLGSMFVAGVAWACLSSDGWRVLTILTALPVALSSVACIALLPESPRWLVVQGRLTEAANVVKYAAEVNGSTLPDFTLSSAGVEKEETVAFSEFLKPAQRRLSIPLWTVWMCFGFTYYGCILFVARVFEDSSASLDELKCDFNYEAIFMSAVSELLGVIVTALVIDGWGRVGTQASLYAGAGVAILLMGMNLPSLTLSVVAVFARFTIMGANSATWVATPEMFPTKLRASGHAVANCMARIGAFFSPFLVESRSLTSVVVGCVLALVNFVAVVASFFLPETAGSNLDDVKEPSNKPQRLIQKANARTQVADNAYEGHSNGRGNNPMFSIDSDDDEAKL
mmetsp:Transcript_24551/g.36146  ORF Transcript_24551/g.36146 Transcript_24551/m.36146 type:complete len:495 (-) Transcript_24551:206-1690(-)